MLPAILIGGAAGGALGTGAGMLTGKALGKYPGQSRDEGARAGAITGAALNAYNEYKGKPPKVFEVIDDAKRVGKGLNIVNPGLVESAKHWARFAGRSAKRYAPEMAVGALAAALLARRKPKKKGKGKTAAAEYSTVGRPPKPAKTTTHGEAINHIQNQVSPYRTKVDTKVAMLQDERKQILSSLRELVSG